MNAVRELRESKGRADLLTLLGPNGQVDAKEDPRLPESTLLKLYSTMVLVRQMDDRMLKLQRQGRIGFYLTSLGEEATHVGATLALDPTDWIFPCYREPGALFARDFSLKDYVSQIFGNAADLLKGRQMPNHWSGKGIRVTSVSSPVGTQIPQAVGFAWAAKIRKDPVVTLVYFGEGATSEGDFHVAANFAGVFQVPVILFCRNNQWAISVPQKRQTASKTFAVKAEAYGFPGVRVDGNDVLAVYKATREAAERARHGGGPTLIEAVTYRMGAHSSSDDPRIYRPEPEMEEWKEKDPILRFRRYLEGKDLWNDQKEREQQDQIAARIVKAVDEAERIGPPLPETLFEDIYASPPWHLEEQKRLMQSLPVAPHGNHGMRPTDRTSEVSDAARTPSSRPSAGQKGGA